MNKPLETVNLFPKDMPEIKKKDIFEVENKKAGTAQKTEGSLNLDPNNKPKQATVNPNATLKPVKSNQ